MLTPFRRSSTYRPDQSVLKPHYFQAELLRYGTTVEMTPTERCAFFRFTFPATGESRVILEPGAGDSVVTVRDDRRSVAGLTRSSSGGTPEGFACYFVAVFDRAFRSWCTFSGEEVYEGEGQREGNRIGFAVDFGDPGAEPVTVRIATSFISIEQAERNLQAEIGDASFEEVRARGERTWEEALGKIQVEDPDENRLRTFYSCLYRTQLFPRMFHEPDAEGKPHHFSPYDGRVHPGVLYTDNGFWDTYRTVYPLYSLLMPERLAEILQGWVNASREGGWFPQWASPGYRACMVGTHIDAVMADAVVRGIEGFDAEAALEGLLKHAYEVGDPSGAFGRIGIEDYIELGYVSDDRHHESVARSLDYAYDDFCIAQVAERLGRPDQAARLRERAQNYRKLYDPTVGFMRGRNANGSWQEPFDEFRWGSPYVEGGAWQSSWAVQHDPAGLIKLMGGEEAFVAKLDAMLETEPRFEVGVYGFEIHEMTEMACADFGQYAHSNQPVHHALYLYNAAGRPWRTQKEVRRVMDELYTPDGFAGDEDNGEMSAWYILSALGIFPLCPGHPSWTLGSPLFQRATLRLANGQDLVVEAPGNTPETVFVGRVLLDNEEVSGLSIPHHALLSSRTLRFEMASSPTERVVPEEQRPFSYSKS
jgi:predicted alpha-1,2-mannosidase